jgi:RNA polymerase sigma factor (TIGR02999 family)
MPDRPLGDIEGQLYAELRRIAGAIGGRAPDASQRTSLVHEAWLRLAASDAVVVQDRQHLLALSARAMRHLLVERARRAATLKRGDGWEQVALDGIGETPHLVDILVLDQALEQLHDADPRAARLAELRLIAGMPLPEAAAAMEISLRTAERDWRAARAFLVVALELDRG